MDHRTRNLVTGLQLRWDDATGPRRRPWRQRARGPILGAKTESKATSAPNDERIEQVLTEHGVILFADPTPGVRLALAPARPT